MRQPLIDSATSVRIKDVSVITVYIDLQPLPFNKGYYAVDMTFFFDVAVELYGCTSSSMVPINGISVFTKKVVLYGSEGNVKMFASDACRDEFDPASNVVLPKATVQVAEPVALSARLCECHRCDDVCAKIPDGIARLYGGDFDERGNCTAVLATIGLFVIVQITRNVQMLIPAYDFCVPEKECVSTTDNPCELFSKIDFPMEEFFPPKSIDGNSCGCK